MENITAETVLASFGKALAHTQRADQKPKKATHYELPIKSIMLHGHELTGVYYDDTEGEKEFKSILFTLQQYGYVTSRINQETTIIRDNTKVQYNQRLWKMTEKGLNKLKELANKK